MKLNKEEVTFKLVIELELELISSNYKLIKIDTRLNESKYFTLCLDTFLFTSFFLNQIDSSPGSYFQNFQTLFAQLK